MNAPCPPIDLPPPATVSRFIDERGRVLWGALRANDKTAHHAAQVLAEEAWDGSTPDEINAILIAADIDPAAIEPLRDDVIAVASRSRRNAYYREKCKGWSII